MKQYIKRITFSAAILLFSGFTVAAEGWSVNDDWFDPFTGEQVVAATTSNKDGFILHIFRSEDGKVRVIYSLPISSFDRLLTEGRVMIIRPDNTASSAIEAKLVPDRIIEYARSNGIAVRSMLWHGSGASPSFGTFRNVLDSSQLFARFFTDASTTVDTVWSLSGSHTALEQALGIEVNVDPAVQEWEQIAADTMSSTLKRCHLNLSCAKRAQFCTPLLVDNKDREGFLQCMAQDGF